MSWLLSCLPTCCCSVDCQRTLRVLKVSGTDRQRDAARTTSAILPGRCSSEEPAPLLHTRSMGHPMLMSCTQKTTRGFGDGPVLSGALLVRLISSCEKWRLHSAECW